MAAAPKASASSISRSALSRSEVRWGRCWASFDGLAQPAGGQRPGKLADEMKLRVGRGRQLRQVRPQALRGSRPQGGLGKRAQIQVLPLEPCQGVLQDHFRLVQDRGLVEVGDRGPVLAGPPQQLAAHQPQLRVVVVLLDGGVQILQQIGQPIMVGAGLDGRRQRLQLGSSPGDQPFQVDGRRRGRRRLWTGPPEGR